MPEIPGVHASKSVSSALLGEFVPAPDLALVKKRRAVAGEHEDP